MNEIKPTRTIGVPQPLVDGPEKVSGKALYSADFLPNNCLVGRIFRSPVAHAEIIRLDISAAEALPGVHGIITGEDCDEPYGVLPIARFEYPMARDKVRYRGEPLACVAAVDVETAQKALNTRDSSALQFWAGSQAQYDALGSYDSSVIYFVT